MRCIVLVLHCIVESCHVLLRRVVSWPLFSCHVCARPGPWHLEKHAQSMLKPSKKRTVLYYCIMVDSSAFSSRAGFGSLCLVISCTVAPGCVVASHLVSCLVRHLASCHDLLPSTCLMSSHCGCFWYDVCFKVSASWHVCSSRVMSCHVMSCHVMSCRVMSCHVMSCHVMSCCVTSCLVISARVTLRSSSGILSRPLISCLVTWRLTSKRVLWTYLIGSLVQV